MSPLSTVAVVFNISKNAITSHLKMYFTLSMVDLVRFAGIVLAILDIENDPLPNVIYHTNAISTNYHITLTLTLTLSMLFLYITSKFLWKISLKV